MSGMSLSVAKKNGRGAICELREEELKVWV